MVYDNAVAPAPPSAHPCAGRAGRLHWVWVGQGRRAHPGTRSRRHVKRITPTTASLRAVTLPDDQTDVFGCTHTGLDRRENEDQFLISSLHKQMRIRDTSLDDVSRLAVASDSLAFFLMVADGVGGNVGGREASQAALEAVTEYATTTLRCYYTGDPNNNALFLSQLYKSVQKCHEAVRQKLPGDSRRTPATTLTVAIVFWPWAYVVQVGDSRCYLLHDGELTQLTRDQTLAQDLYDEGVFNTSDAASSPFGHILTSAIGSGKAKAQVTRVRIQGDDTLLLCTDGLTKHVGNEEIQHVLAAASPARDSCHELIDRALADGGSDNVTVVIGRFNGPTEGLR